MSDSSRAKPIVANLGKIGEARLELVPQLAECRPGIAPTEYNVVIAPARAAATVGKAGLLIAPDEVRESAGMAMQVGRIISMSPIAFNYDKWPSEKDKPKVGQLVWFARYAGALFEGIDGQEYRIVKDKDIGATIIEDQPPPAREGPIWPGLMSHLHKEEAKALAWTVEREYIDGEKP